MRRAFVIGILCVALVFAASPCHAASLETATAKLSHDDFIGAAQDLTWLARRGNARAQAMLGFLYETGQGVPQAYDAAAYWYCRAADRGDSRGQYLLGLAYDKGHGVPQDYIAAYKWLDLAASHASPNLREPFTRLRDAVASKMSRWQINIAQRQALLWAPGRNF